MRTIRGQTRRDRNLKARPRSQRTPVSCSQSGRVVSGAAEASGLSRSSAVPCAPRAFMPRSLPTLFPRPPAGLPGRTPAGTHPLPRLGDRASGCRPLRPCPAESAPERPGKSADARSRCRWRFYPPLAKTVTFFSNKIFYDTAGDLMVRDGGRRGKVGIGNYSILPSVDTSDALPDWPKYCSN